MHSIPIVRKRQAPENAVNLDSFKKLHDNARLWVYAFDEAMSDQGKRLVHDRLVDFLNEWHSHRARVEGAFSIAHDRFVILAAVSQDGISGCSIDGSVENFKYFRDQHGLDALSKHLVYYRDSDGRIKAIDRAAFQGEIDGGRCGPSTIVFDTTIQTLADLRAGRFEIPLQKSWHAKAFLPA